MSVTDPVNRERFSDSRAALTGLKTEAETWIADRQKRDRHGQYVTQLGTLKQQFDVIFKELGEALGAVSEGPDRRGFYAACRGVDSKIIWARRVFDWYRHKFDQRDDPVLARTLEAADEIVWSCYAQPFRAVGQTPPAVPLPFIEPTYSPSAIPRVDPPQDLRSDVNAEFLRRVLNELPVPVVALPYACVEDPWWLAFAAHEVGHHVEFDLFGGRLQEAFVAAVKGVGGDRWSGWHEELFADAFSVLMIGPWASWALAELVWDADDRMLDDRRPRYPAPLIRMLFMSEIATALTVDATPALRGLNPEHFFTGDPVVHRGRDLRAIAAADAAIVRPLAKRVLESFDADATRLGTLCAFDAAEFSGEEPDVLLWARALRGQANMDIRQDLRSARLVLAAAVQAWADVTELPDDDERAKERERLKKATLETIVASREEITREAAEPAMSAIDAGSRNVVELLMRDAPPVI